ncbi:MAG TPA: efflux transporter outer membrane subunit, partial [Novosphingobium sp.]|nr:efflux transporter outer membrane subunit [Novosphingobium sp.]
MLRSGIAGAVLAGLLAGCSQAPAYHPPAVALPAQFSENAGPWAPAAPARADIDARWWHSLGDAQLDALEDRLLADNPDLAAALARHQAAVALLVQARADTMPQVSAGAQLTSNRQSDDRPLRGSGQPDEYGAHTLSGTASFELDLWGRVRDSVRAARADAQAAADDAAAARLALTADLASTYIALRGADAEIAILTDAVDAYGKADAVTRHRFDEGVASGIDVGRADAQLADAQAQLADERANRAVLAHAVEALAGAPAGTMDLADHGVALALLPAPAMVPSVLLQRRPDIAAAERRMYAANRAIGVAKAALYPQIGLGATGGVQST